MWNFDYFKRNIEAFQTAFHFTRSIGHRRDILCSTCNDISFHNRINGVSSSIPTAIAIHFRPRIRVFLRIPSVSKIVGRNNDKM